ncbi:MAG TPA: hypothetical protein VJ436_05315 [Anaerolineales bacterium]|nr:hypothetical protein [Anaerolineales bacterium]
MIGDPGVGKSRLLTEFERWVVQSGVQAMIFRARGRPGPPVDG